ncbi:EpsG family protein [Bacillus sp. REN10]|uniref:EpsG family protein n=1 Tax=Bacillus sp. REN10 TaxID=2782541 RepID=UPI00193C477F|nr:EpsG family protein [Bacillus sp. REN10]
MSVYIAFIIVTVIFMIVEKAMFVNKTLVRKIYLIILITFSGFRYNVGWDYKAYSMIIDSLRNYGINIYDKGEPLSNLLLTISSKFQTNLFFFLITSIVIYYLIIKTLDQYSVNYYLSLLFFIGFPLFYLNSLSVIRNFIAIAICFWAYKYLKKNQTLKYMIAVLIAFLFHKTALVALLLIPLRNVRINKVFSVILITSSFFLQTVFVKIFEYVRIPGYSNYFIELDMGANHGGNKVIFMLLLIFVILLLVHNEKVSKEANFFYNSFVIGLFFYNAFLDMGTVAHRATLYFTMYGLLALPEYIKLYKKERLLISYSMYCAFICMFVYTIYLTINMVEGPYIPYRLFPLSRVNGL